MRYFIIVIQLYDGGYDLPILKNLKQAKGQMNQKLKIFGLRFKIEENMKRGCCLQSKKGTIIKNYRVFKRVRHRLQLERLIQRMDTKRCAFCKHYKKTNKKCPICKEQYLCGRNHQKKDWNLVH